MPKEIFYVLLLVVVANCLQLKIGDLASETVEELRSIESYGDIKANCTNHKPESNPKYLLFQRDHQEDPIVLTSSNLDQVSPSKKTIVLIPGWLTTYTTPFVKELIDAYLKRYDCNVIIVDWSKTAFRPYSYIYCDVPSLGLHASKFLCQMSRTVEIELDQIHIVGYTFGGQIAGYIGRNVKLQCDQEIGRITGLDAAGPLYERAAPGKSLTKTDALFVDVIHTTSSLGMWKNCGQVDLHPNCKTHNQPGCPYPPLNDDDTLVTDSLCSSLRSVEYMIESIQSSQLIGVSCSLCSRYCSPDIITEVYAIMGEDCREVPKSADNFLIYTRSTRPYGQGMLPYPYIKNMF